MDVPERLGGARSDRDGVTPLDARAKVHRLRAHFAQASPLDVFDDDVGLPARVGRCLDDLRDAMMLELRLDARLVEKARDEGLVRCVVAPDDLDHAWPLGTLDAGRRRQVNFPHAPAGKPSEQPQPPEGPGNTLIPCLVPHDGRFCRHGPMVPMWDEVGQVRVGRPCHSPLTQYDLAART